MEGPIQHFCSGTVAELTLVMLLNGVEIETQALDSNKNLSTAVLVFQSINPNPAPHLHLFNPTASVLQT